MHINNVWDFSCSHQPMATLFTRATQLWDNLPNTSAHVRQEPRRISYRHVPAKLHIVSLGLCSIWPSTPTVGIPESALPQTSLFRRSEDRISNFSRVLKVGCYWVCGSLILRTVVYTRLSGMHVVWNLLLWSACLLSSHSSKTYHTKRVESTIVLYSQFVLHSLQKRL